MFLETTLVGAVDFADTLITDFGGATVWGSLATELAPTLLIVAYSSNTGGAAHEINIYLATAAGQFGTQNMIRIVTVNALTAPPTANYADLIGGQSGCRRVYRTSGTPMQLRCTTAGKASTATIRIEWQIAPGVFMS